MKNNYGCILEITSPSDLLTRKCAVLVTISHEHDIEKNGRQVPCMVWSERWLPFLNLFDKKGLPVHECVVSGVPVRSCLKRHPHAGTGCSATHTLSKGEPVKCYNGTLVFQGKCSFHEEKVYGKGMMAALG